MKKLITMLLAATMLLSMVACSGDNEGTNTNSTTTTATTTRRQETVGTQDPNATTPPTTGSGYDADVYLPYGSPVVDGVKDPIWDTATPLTLDIVMKDAPEASVTAYQMWDSENLYFFFEIDDVDVAQDAAIGDYNNDGIYLYISELCSFDITSMDSYSQGTYQFAIINPDLTMIPRKGEQDLTEDDYEVNVNIIDSGITIEFSYKPKYMTMEAGSQFCLDYQYNDSTSGGTRIGCLSWYRVTDGDASPLSMGIGELLAEGETVPTT